MKKLFAAIGAVLSVVYIINPTAGLLEIIPDNIPGIGNLDEAAVTGILIACLRVLGLDVLRLFGKKEKNDNTDVVDID